MCIVKISCRTCSRDVGATASLCEPLNKFPSPLASAIKEAAERVEARSPGRDSIDDRGD